MTAIVGLRHNGRVYIAGDSAGASGSSITVRADPKVFRAGPYVMGFTSSFRMGQLLRFSEPPAPTADVDRFMVTTFVDHVRSTLRTGGWLSKEADRETGGTFLVGVGSDMFTIYSDFQVERTVDDYAAIGSGTDLALGSLHSSAGWKPRRRLVAALDAASYHSTWVCPPYSIQRT